MLEYASMDVMHLPRAYESIKQRLIRLENDSQNKLENKTGTIQEKCLGITTFSWIPD
jgi:hypothetical protein